MKSPPRSGRETPRAVTRGSTTDGRPAPETKPCVLGWSRCSSVIKVRKVVDERERVGRPDSVPSIRLACGIGDMLWFTSPRRRCHRAAWEGSAVERVGTFARRRVSGSEVVSPVRVEMFAAARSPAVDLNREVTQNKTRLLLLPYGVPSSV